MLGLRISQNTLRAITRTTFTRSKSTQFHGYLLAPASCRPRYHSTSPAAPSSRTAAAKENPSSNDGIALGTDTLPENKPTIDAPRLMIQFTCTVIDCSTRSSHEFSKKSYETGIVIVQCPGCKNRHLIADHLGWFKDVTGEGKFKTIESIMKEQGEIVKRGSITNGVISYEPEQ